jgi:hypothetical protein
MAARELWLAATSNLILATAGGIAVGMFALSLGFTGSALAQSPKETNDSRRETGQQIRFFVSGHSLTDNPLPEFVAAIARSRGYRVSWNQQVGIGSPIRARTLGNPNKSPPWNGYKSGKNNGGYNLDVVAELRERRGFDGYNILIVAEAHRTVSQLRWNDTVRYLRHFHELLIEGNPEGTTYLYEPWEGIAKLSDLVQWINLEREATKAWGCATTRINLSLEHEGRTDRVKSLPIGAGVVELIERATSLHVTSISAGSTDATVKQLMSDGVHLSRLGIYYAALLSYTGITGRSPIGAWRPDFVTEGQAAALQDIAWSFYEKRNNTYRALSLQECVKYMSETFCNLWDRYIAVLVSDSKVRDCELFFQRQSIAAPQYDAPNPFFFDPAVDAKYWFPPP